MPLEFEVDRFTSFAGVTAAGELFAVAGNRQDVKFFVNNVKKLAEKFAG